MGLEEGRKWWQIPAGLRTDCTRDLTPPRGLPGSSTKGRGHKVRAGSSHCSPACCVISGKLLVSLHLNLLICTQDHAYLPLGQCVPFVPWVPLKPLPALKVSKISAHRVHSQRGGKEPAELNTVHILLLRPCPVCSRNSINVHCQTLPLVPNWENTVTETGLWPKTDLGFQCCATWGKFCNLSELLFPHG